MHNVSHVRLGLKARCHFKASHVDTDAMALQRGRLVNERAIGFLSAVARVGCVRVLGRITDAHLDLGDVAKIGAALDHDCSVDEVHGIEMVLRRKHTRMHIKSAANAGHP